MYKRRKREPKAQSRACQLVANSGIKIEKTMSQKIDPNRKEETWREQFYDSQKIS